MVDLWVKRPNHELLIQALKMLLVLSWWHFVSQSTEKGQKPTASSM
jgi:hypothetical protein